MSVPKQRHSKMRQARGRVRYVKKVKTLKACPKCGANVLSHRVCPKCGFYKDREYIDTMKGVAPVAKTKNAKPVGEKEAKKKEKTVKKKEAKK